MTVCNSLLAIQCSVRGPRVNETRLLAQSRLWCKGSSQDKLSHMMLTIPYEAITR